MKKILAVLLLIGGVIPSLAADRRAAATQPMGIFEVYRQNRQQGIPNYITVDLWLSAYCLLRQQVWREREQNVLEPDLRNLSKVLTQAAAAQPEDAAGQANRDFAAVLGRLLQLQQAQPLTERARAELERVTQAQGPALSPLWGYRLDYSQFKPRGRYTATAAMQRYFTAYRYLSNVAFYINPGAETGVSETLADRLVTQTRYWLKSFNSRPAWQAALGSFNADMEWSLGPADDLTAAELQPLAAAQAQASAADWRAAVNRYAEQQQRLPRLLGGLAEVRSGSGTWDRSALLAWRLLPARVNAESVALQALLYPRTGTFTGESEQPVPFGLLTLEGQRVKAFPSSYELAMFNLGVIGDKQLAAWQESRFERYQQARDQALQTLNGATGLNAEQLRLFKMLLQPQDDGSIRLPTALAFWTWQRYLELLYQKPGYSLVSKGIDGDPARTGARLEQAEPVYRQLAALAAAHYRHTQDPRWQRFGELLQQAARIDQRNTATPVSQAFLNGLDRRLRQLCEQDDAPIVVDIHSEPNSRQVVEEAVGYADIAFNGRARGARLTHYEFKQPLSQRLNDADWRKLLDRDADTKRYKTYALNLTTDADR